MSVTLDRENEYDALAIRLDEIDLDPNASPEERAYADLLGVSRGQVTNLVNGHRAISKDIAKKLSAYFRLDITAFLD